MNLKLLIIGKIYINFVSGILNYRLNHSTIYRSIILLAVFIHKKYAKITNYVWMYIRNTSGLSYTISLLLCVWLTLIGLG